MSKVFKNFVGIDISKTWFDAALISSSDLSTLIHQQFLQTTEGYSKMQAWLQQQDVSLDEETLFCMEYTGIYNTRLVGYLAKQQARLWVEMPLCV